MGLDTNRVLRVGVVWRGQVVAERVLDRRTDVSVGTRPEATVVIDAKQYPEFPALVPLAVLHQNSYHVVLPTDPAHTINLRGGPSGGAAAIDKNSVVQVKGARTLPIEAYTGGSLSLGEVILMFQFVRSDSVPTVTREETVLRLGLVHEDRLLSDQVFRAGEPVTIGHLARNTLVLPDTEYKGGAASFVGRNGGVEWQATLPKGSEFKLALEGQPPVSQAEAIAKKLAQPAGDGGVVLTLPVKSRGRASFGPYTLLFQVVKQSVTVPAMPRKSFFAQLAGPLVADSVWTVSFLVALVLIGSIVGQAIIFQRTTGKYLNEQKAEEQAEHNTYEVTIEEKEEPKPEEEEEKKVETEVMPEEVKKKAEKEDRKADKAEQQKPSNTAEKQLNPEEVKRNAREAVQKNTLAGAFGQGAGTRLFGDAEEGEEGTVVAKTFGGSGGDGDGSGGPGSTGIKIANTGGGGSLEKTSLGGKKTFERKAEATQVEVKKEEKKVEIKLSSSEMGGEGEGKGDVAKVIARKNSAVQQCYEKALRDNPDEGGKVKVSFTVGTAGTVTDVSVSGASGSFGDCIKAKFMAIRGLPILGSPQSFNQSYVFSKN